ncbi:hypothetical protein WMF38_19175 [Sorangium sp. So ce118]
MNAQITTTPALKNIETAMIAPATTSDWTNLKGQFRGTPAGVFYGNSLFAFVRNTDSSLGMCSVDSTGSTGSWTRLAGALVSDPAVAASPNGTLGIIALLQGNVVAINYVQPFQGVQTGFNTIGGGSPTQFVGTPVLALNVNQRIEAFMLDTQGTMWHTFQTVLGPSITWSNWSPLGRTFLTTATFSVFLNTNTGVLQVVALGTDNQMYQMIQNAGGGNDGWSAPALVGQTPTNPILFINGTAAANNTSNTCPVYAGHNGSAGSGQNPLVYCAPPSPSQWTNLPTLEQPMPSNVPVMVSNNGVPELAYLTPSNQVILLVQNVSGTGFWKFAQNVGKPDPRFTGRIGAVVNSGSLALFQGYADGTLSFINYSPS